MVILGLSDENYTVVNEYNFLYHQTYNSNSWVSRTIKGNKTHSRCRTLDNKDNQSQCQKLLILGT